MDPAVVLLGRPLTVYKNGSVLSFGLSTSVPFDCSAQVNQRDCHLSVQLVVQEDEDEQTARSGGHHRPALLALSHCHLSMAEEEPGVQHHFLAVPVVDFGHQLDGSVTNVTVRMVVSTYGDAWWHGYQLPDITIQVITQKLNLSIFLL